MYVIIDEGCGPKGETWQQRADTRLYNELNTACLPFTLLIHQSTTQPPTESKQTIHKFTITTTIKMSDNKNTAPPSTLQSYVDSATGAVQSVIGSLTGNTADQSQGEAKKDHAAAEKELSQAGTSIGGVSISASGIAKNDPNRTDGSWNQTIGSAKESLGNLTGIQSLKQEGAKQNAEGKEQEAKGQLSDLGSGVSDRVSGAVGGAVAGLTGDRAEQEKRNLQHDQGKTLQRGAEADIAKQNPPPQ
ncbi:hypothetical protein EG328_003897 [Venturia inaequalis]|uniref:CsbD-like domain-containing protein n=1 Tax=Venturia inaequalis TaxID=5025 RepID=A0A8H3YYJ2_VENIN|nr:hypothetical protein EG328_003897 [Venturia inaequalis]